MFGELRLIESCDISLRRSFDLFRIVYLFLGSLSVSANKFLLSLIVLIRVCAFSSISSSLLRSSGKNFLLSDSTIGKAKIYSQVGL